MASKAFHILGQEVLPGKTHKLSLNIARFHTGAMAEIPVMVAHAKAPGPVLLICAGIHGNEINGVEIVRQLISQKLHVPQRGTVICIPVLNIFGYLNQTREFPDGRDLNRAFPGSKSGSLASRFAYHIMKEIIPHIDYCLDFHTGGDSRFNFTQLRLEGNDPDALELAFATEIPFILLAKKRSQSLRSAASKLGKKVLLFEGGKSLHLDRMVTTIGLQVAMKAMQHLNMREFAPDQLKPGTHPILLHHAHWIRAPFSGLFRGVVRTGAWVTKGTVLGTISDPFGSPEKKVRAKRSGYLICSNHSPIVNQGDALFNLGYADEGSEVASNFDKNPPFVHDPDGNKTEEGIEQGPQ